MSAPRRICVVTGTRAEYGLLYWLLRDIAADPALELQLVVTGMHLSPEFGLTVRDIERDGFAIDQRVEMLLSSDTGVGTAKAMGLGLIGFADAWSARRPDIVVLLGDRFEMLAAASAALALRLPMAHIHGGELTEGAMDDAIRHALSKLAHLHFTAAEDYRQRVIRMGEAPERVYNVGAPGLDNLLRLPLLERAALAEALGHALRGMVFLVTFHPETLSKTPDETQGLSEVDALLAALDTFPDAQVVLTLPNADPGGRGIAGRLREWAADWARRDPGRVQVHASLGSLRYLSLMRAASVVIGNSSSGLLEAPSLNVPSVNIGARQRGRLRAGSVLDCAAQAEDIARAILQALDPAWRAARRGWENPYGPLDEAGASRRILQVLRTADLDGLLCKRFHDVACNSTPGAVE